MAAAAYYKYTGDAKRACRAGLRKDPQSTIENWQRVNAGNEELMKCRVARFGPVVAGYFAAILHCFKLKILQGKTIQSLLN